MHAEMTNADAWVRHSIFEGSGIFVAEGMGPDARAAFDLQTHGDKD